MSPKVALIGCGGMGRRHIGGMGLLKDAGHMTFELTSLCDLMPENLQKAVDTAQEKLGVTPEQYTDFDKMVTEQDLDAVIITTTPETHTAIGKQAFNAGLHVMVEKPISLTVAQGKELVGAAERTGLKLAVAENYRRDPINRLAKALIESSIIGAPFLAIQSSSGSGEQVIITPWRHLKQRGGIIFDMGVHYTDILEFFLGPMTDVFAMNAVVDTERVDTDGKAHPADAEDLSVGTARFANGAIANWMLSMAGRGEGHFTRMIYGTQGSLAIPHDRSGKPLSLTLRHDGKDEVIPAESILDLVPEFKLDSVTAALFGGERLSQYEMEWAQIDGNLLAIEQADFIDAIKNNRQPEVDGVQGLRSLALMFGFLEAEYAKRAVNVDEILSGDMRSYEASLEDTGEGAATVP